MNKKTLIISAESFGYFKCESEKEQNEVMSLCDMIGLVLYENRKWGFDLCPWILLSGNSNYMQSAIGSSIECQNFTGHDFITASDFIPTSEKSISTNFDF